MRIAMIGVMVFLVAATRAVFALDGAELDRVAIHAAANGSEEVRAAVATLRQAGYFKGALNEQLISEAASRPAAPATFDPQASAARATATLNNLFPERVWVTDATLDVGTGIQALTISVSPPPDPRQAGMRGGMLRLWQGVALMDQQGHVVNIICTQPIPQQ